MWVSQRPQSCRPHSSILWFGSKTSHFYPSAIALLLPPFPLCTEQMVSFVLWHYQFCHCKWAKVDPVLQWKQILNTDRTTPSSACCMYLFLLRKIWRNNWHIFTCLCKSNLQTRAEVEGAWEPFHTGCCCYTRSWKIKHCRFKKKKKKSFFFLLLYS